MRREHRQRLLIAALGLPLAFATAWLGGAYFVVFICFVASVSVYELLKMVQFPHRALMIIALIITPVLIIALHYMKYNLFFILLVTTAMLTNISLLFYKRKEYIKTSFVGMGSILYPGMCLATLVLFRGMFIVTPENTTFGRQLVFAIMICVFSTDIFAYYSGKLFGKRKLWPSVSPKKTLEGSLGGFLGCVLVSSILYYFDFIPFFNYIDYLALSVSAGIFGQLGDLVESKIKREIGVKDSSKLLLEHGGFLDRFDSLATAAPIFWVYINFKYGMI